MVSSGVLSLRAASYAFKIFEPWFQGGVPSHTVIQNWVLRYGLHMLESSKEKRDDWIYVLDHTIEFGQKKCLLVIGITLEDFQKNNCKVRHEDAEVLVIDIETKADANSVYESLKLATQKTGTPIQMISDHGSNIWKGVELFIEESKSNIMQTYDVTHKASIILKKQLENNERWKEFVNKMSYTKKSLVHTILAFMAPGKPKEKARWLNLENYLTWAYSAIQQGTKKMNELEKDKFTERVSWIKEYKKDLKLWNNMLIMLNLMKYEVKSNGLGKKTVEAFQCRLDKSKIKINTPELKEVYSQIYEYLLVETQGLTNSHVLGCSDIIESIFGKYKKFSARSPMKEVGKSILTIPVFTNEVTPERVLTAMEKVSAKKVDQWLKKKLSKSLFAKRKKFFLLGKTKKSVKFLFQNLSKVANF